MYVDGSSCFVPSIQEDEFPNTNHNFSTEEDLSSYHQNPSQVDAITMEMTLQQHLGINANMCYDNNITDNNNTHHLIQETNNDRPNQSQSYDQDQHSNWVHEMSYNNIGGQNPNPHNFIMNSSLPPDLLNLLPFMNQTTNQTNFHTVLGDMSSTVADSGSYDPLLPLNLPPQPPLFRDLFQSLPQGYMLPGFRSGSLLGGLDEREGDRGVFENGDGRSYDSGVLEFTRDINCLVKKRNNGKGSSKPFATEKHRRQQFNDKYRDLKDLLPSPTKPDRASIVGDAIDYIKELLRTVTELKILMEKKRCGKERTKRQKMEQDGGDVESCIAKPEAEDSYNNNNSGSSSMRCSWLQRKSKETEVDVRIIDDEVTIKLAQRKKINCLLIVSKVLDELQLDVHHVAGGLVGDNFSFLFNTKICEGSCVYASAIANKLIEAVDRQYAAILPTSSF